MEKTTNNSIPELTPEQRQAIISEHHRQGGLKGGATLKKRGRAYFQEIGRKGAQKRWADKKAKEESNQD